MKSTSGAHFIALDHVRCFAAFTVFSWHFLHGAGGKPVPYEYAPDLFPLALIDEGHTGVALFMTLSGYLFAKLLNGKEVNYGSFLWNRVLRLVPLLLVVFAFYGVQHYLSGAELGRFFRTLVAGLLLPSWPGGCWSITVEAHFYLLLPLLLRIDREHRFGLLGVVLAAICLRFAVHCYCGEVQRLAYSTLVGRIDQFALGICAYRARELIARRHLTAALSLAAFSLFYWHFDRHGGYYDSPGLPSRSRLWIVMPALEGAFYAFAVAYYDLSFRHSTRGVSRFVSTLGAYSYSVYLLHFFVVFELSKALVSYSNMSNFYVVCFISLVCFLLLMPIGYLSYRFIESPFLRLRTPYIVDTSPVPEATPQSQWGGAPPDATISAD